MLLNLQQYTYVLPSDRIAIHPLPERDQSKLLVYKAGEIQHDTFTSITEHLPANSLLFFNDTKVIPARILFKKESGAEIEIFLLEPISPATLLVTAMQATGTAIWKCAIGNAKRWKDGTTLMKEISGIKLTISLKDREKGLVRLTWNDETFATLVSAMGETPLPPYLKRPAEKSDRERYQTVYSTRSGAVAAPTAGLHFTQEILRKLAEKNLETDFLTLHVSAGTFQPVKVDNALDHVMHHEQITVSRKNVENLLGKKFIVAVGTTSMRTLESLYWYGVKLLKNPEAFFVIEQHDAMKSDATLPSATESLRAVLRSMKEKGVESLTGETSIFIVPGYTFRICQGLITNFHQPGSTLILLVAAFIGEDWKRVYDAALQNDYRFLSYGDSSLLLPRSVLQ
ncbi:MAG: S-adenosylmethionine:tRNA ribosyltransferase-isomerase [Chryseolinea sp.]